MLNPVPTDLTHNCPRHWPKIFCFSAPCRAKMDTRGAALLLWALRSIGAVVTPSGVAPAAWPLGTATPAESNTSWPLGFQPPRLGSWTMDPQGRPLACWETTALHDHAKGWPGLCLGLFNSGLEKISDQKTCKDACYGDARCSVWQFNLVDGQNSCWIGMGGFDCDFRSGQQDSITVQGAERVQHGKIHVYKTLAGMKINKLYNFGLYAEGSQLLTMEVCLLSSEVLTVLDSEEVEGKTALAVKQALVPKVGVSRFRQKLLDGADEIPDDQVFTSAPARVQLVKLEFCPPDAEEDEKMLFAAICNDVVSLEHFLRCPRDPNITGEGCETPLHCAAESGHGEPVRLLLEAAAEVDRRGNMTGTPLFWAAQYGNSEAVSLLLDAGANKDEPTTEPDDGATPMHIAACGGHLDVVQMLLEAGAKIDEPRTEDGTTPLFDAVYGGNLHMVRLLVEAGARKDAVAEHDGSTPLCFAAELDRLAIVQFLVESGADKDHATHNGLTPLHFAAKRGHFNIVKCLVESGANSDLRMNGDEATALDLATQYGHADVVQFLSEVRAKLPPRKTRRTR
eukprot:s723_g2.t1